MNSDRTKLLLNSVLPARVWCMEQVGQLHGSLLNEEASLLTPGTISRRREEFAAGRTCARQALAKLGVAPQPVLQGSAREPLWPCGVVGSITHCPEYCAAAVASCDLLRALGVDAEPNEPLPPDVLPTIARASERAWLERLGRDGAICWDRLLFSMKESVYKVWHPLEKSWLDFHEAEIVVDPERHTFKATLLRETSACPRVLTGRFTATRSYLLSGIVIRVAS